MPPPEAGSSSRPHPAGLALIKLPLQAIGSGMPSSVFICHRLPVIRPQLLAAAPPLAVEIRA